jgi:hypothetical protein
MHSSVIQAKDHRNVENGRRYANAHKRKAQGLMRAFGLEPSFTPSPFGKKRAIRQAESRPERLQKYKTKCFFVNFARLFGNEVKV